MSGICFKMMAQEKEVEMKQDWPWVDNCPMEVPYTILLHLYMSEISKIKSKD